MERFDKSRSGSAHRRGLLMLLWSAVALLSWPVAGRIADPPFWRPELAPVGPMVMLVSLDEQRIYVYRNGVAIGASRISSGRSGYETPTGIYTILQKEREHYSNLYDNAPMPYMQRLTWDGLALHAGKLPGHPDSHGCIRLPESFAERLFEVSPRGTVVVVTDQRVAPPAINHPAAIAPLDLGGLDLAPQRVIAGDTEVGDGAIVAGGGAKVGGGVSRQHPVAQGPAGAPGLA